MDLKKLSNIEKTLEYHELLMTRELKNIPNYILPSGFTFCFWDNDKLIDDWIKIHIDTGEFNCIEEAYKIFHSFYDNFYTELSSRCLFIKDSNGEIVATSTVSPADEFGYNCVIDWFAISPKAQGKKLSKALLTKTLNVAKSLGYDKILLHTQTHTWLAAKIYLDFGFEPFENQNTKGWDILKTITNHQKLNKYKTLNEEQLFDPLIIKIKNELDKIHKNYFYSVWYVNGRNDVFVRQDKNFFKYKYQLEKDTVSLIKQ